MSEPVATNRKAFRDYAISDTVECGIVLTGGEIKSVRAGKVNFKDSFARLDGNEVYLHNLHIEPYLQASYMNDDPDRVRKLLLHTREIKKLIGNVAQKGLTLVPTKVYFNKRGMLKVEIGVARGKRSYDKRETVKKRDIDREIRRVAAR